jgi:hypothetical protein
VDARFVDRRRYGVARMFSVFAEALRANITPFQSLEEARVWLETQPSAAA